MFFNYFYALAFVPKLYRVSIVLIFGKKFHCVPCSCQAENRVVCVCVFALSGAPHKLRYLCLARNPEGVRASLRLFCGSRVLQGLNQCQISACREITWEMHSGGRRLAVFPRSSKMNCTNIWARALLTGQWWILFLKSRCSSESLILSKSVRESHFSYFILQESDTQAGAFFYILKSAGDKLVQHLKWGGRCGIIILQLQGFRWEITAPIWMLANICQFFGQIINYFNYL